MASKIIYSDLSIYSLSASEGYYSNYYLTNLLNYFSDSIWKSSNSNSAQWISIDLGSNKIINSLIVDNHNFDSIMATGNARLEYSNDSSFTSTIILISSISASDTGPQLYEFNDINKRYFRILYNGTLNANPYIGNLFLSNKLSFDFNYNFGYKKEDQNFETNENINLKGSYRNSQNYIGRLVYELNFKMLTNTFKNNFITFIQIIRNKLRPFYFIDFDGTIRYMKLDSDYLPIQIQKYGLNDLINLKMKSFNVDSWISNIEGQTIISNILETEEIII